MIELAGSAKCAPNLQNLEQAFYHAERYYLRSSQQTVFLATLLAQHVYRFSKDSFKIPTIPVFK